MKLSDILFKFDGINKYMAPQEFWCHICDQAVVKSEDPASGVWFQASGHVRKARFISKWKGGLANGSLDDSGDHEVVIFAVCTKCYGDFKYE